MNIFRNNVLPLLSGTMWMISISEFVRNEFLIKDFWTEHYDQMGQIFPAEPINGAIWGIWSLCFAIVIFILSGKFNLLQTFLLSWFIGFILMWLVIGNLGVLPFGILPFAIPLSLLEAFIASLIMDKLKR